MSRPNATPLEGEDELIIEDFGKWIEANGVVLEQWEESKGFRAIVDLNRLKSAILAYTATKEREAEDRGYQIGIRHKHYWFRDEQNSFCEGCGLPREDYEKAS